MPRCARCAARCSKPTSRSTWRAPSSSACANARSASTSSSRSRPARWWSRSSMTNWSRRSAPTRRPIDLNAPAPVAIMMVGLQGSGKTTTTAKIAKRLTDLHKSKVLMASLDTRRPAAMEQLAVLGKQVGVDTLPIVAGQTPAADRQARDRGREARRLRRRAARHRRPHHARRSDDGGSRRGASAPPIRMKCCWSPMR